MIKLDMINHKQLHNLGITLILATLIRIEGSVLYFLFVFYLDIIVTDHVYKYRALH